jgi:hypothetical protein
MRIMARLLAAAFTSTVLALGGSAAIAGPPIPGTLHTFIDPTFRDTVICDTLDQVRRIATAETPDDMYAALYMTTNEYDEPMCVAVVPTGEVVEATPLGVMERNGRHYNAWAVETRLPGGTVFALYLEHVVLTNA